MVGMEPMTSEASVSEANPMGAMPTMVVCVVVPTAASKQDSVDGNACIRGALFRIGHGMGE